MNLLTKRNLLLINSTILALLVLGNVVFSGSYATSGEKLRQLEQEKQQLIESNQDLKRYILENSSLTSLEKKASQLGFTQPDMYISVSQPSSTVALSQ